MGAGLGGKGGNLLASVDVDNILSEFCGRSSEVLGFSAGETWVGCLQNGFVELAFGAADVMMAFWFGDGTFAIKGGRTRFFLAATLRKSTLWSLSSRREVLFDLDEWRNGLCESDDTPVVPGVTTRGCV